MRLKLVVILAFLIAPVLDGRAAREIPDDNLAYPVLINIRDGGGSGFFIRIGPTQYFVTAKHVLFKDVVTPESELRSDSAELISYSRDPKEATRNRFSLDLKALRAAGRLKVHPSRDVAVIEIAKVDSLKDVQTSTGELQGMRTLPSVTIKESASKGILSAPREGLRLYEDVLVGNEVIVFGYPASLGLKELPQLDLSRPLLRRGIVAGLNAELKSIVLDCPVYPGNSGGPVLQVDQEAAGRTLRVIGVVSQFVPFVANTVSSAANLPVSILLNSGYSIATPIDFVLELIGQ
jgi:S1-C subfamily serine protease